MAKKATIFAFKQTFKKQHPNTCLCSACARTLVGGLSKPSKMPCPSYSIPATACKAGAQLVKLPGSVCHGCYALKGMYRFPVVKTALERRLASLEHPQWVDAMTVLISRTGSKWFRWHDSGDIQDAEHLQKIFEVARRLPHVRFWLPTRERGIVARTLRLSVCPPNLAIRISATMIDGPPLKDALTSTVVSRGATCPAHLQGNKCLDCRACWDKSIQNIAYNLH
jgi:hypothetical protein